MNQRRRVDGACINDEAGDLHSIYVRDGESGPSGLRNERREAEAHHDGVGVEDADGVFELVDAWGENEALAQEQREVDCFRVGCGFRDEEVVD